VPSRGAAAEIVRALLALQPGTVAGLTLHTPESFARKIVNTAGELPAVAGDLERRLAMKVIAASLSDESGRGRGLDAMVDRTWRDVRDSGTTLEQLERRMSDPRFRRTERHDLLIRGARAYQSVLEAMGLIDPADLLERATSLIGSNGWPTPQLVFGFYDMTGAQLRFLQALTAAGRVDSIHVPVPEGRAAGPYRFAAKFLRDVDVSGMSAAATTPPDVSLRAFRTRRDEFGAIVESIRRLLANGAAAEEIGIVCRRVDPREALILGQYAGEAGFAMTSRAGIPLKGQRVGRALLRLLRLREHRFARNQVIDLLRDGVRVRAVWSREMIDLLDRLTRRNGIAGGDGTAVRLALDGLRGRDEKGAERLAPYLAAVEELEELAAVPVRATGAQWADLIERLLAAIPIETDRDTDAFGAVAEVTTTLRSAPRTLCDTETVIELIESLTIPGATAAGPQVWFGDVMMMRGRSFRHLFAFALQEDRFPQSRVPDPLLNDAERSSLGLPLIGDGRDEEEFLFQLLLDSADTIQLSWATTDGFGNVQRPSPYLRRYDRPDVDETFRAETPSRALTPLLQRQIRFLGATGTRSEHDGYVRLDAAMQAEVRRRLELTSPTVFEDFGECPQKFLFKRLLRADELEDPEHEAQINRLDKGLLDHQILERFYREAPQDRLAFFAARLASRLPDDLAALLSRIVAEEFDRFDQLHPPFNATIRGMERRLTEKALARFLIEDLSEIQELKLRPYQFEFTFGPRRDGEPSDHPDPIELELNAMSVAMRGSIDRIDRSAAEPYRYRVVDYKSGKAARFTKLAERIETGHRLQLAIYAIAAEIIFGVPADRISGAIKPLGAPGKTRETHSFELAEQKEMLLLALDEFADSIVQGRFPAIPDEESCRYCPVNSSCRTRHDADEKRALRKHENALALLREETA
jgi:hypothetical protein